MYFKRYLLLFSVLSQVIMHNGTQQEFLKNENLM